MKYLKEYNETEHNLIDDITAIVESHLQNFSNKFKWVYEYYEERNVNFYFNIDAELIDDDNGHVDYFQINHTTKRDVENSSIYDMVYKQFSNNRHSTDYKIRELSTYISFGTVYNDNEKSELNEENYTYIVEQLDNQRKIVDKLYSLRNDKNITNLEYYYPKFSLNYRVVYDTNKVKNIFKKLNK